MCYLPKCVHYIRIIYDPKRVNLFVVEYVRNGLYTGKHRKLLYIGPN